MRWTEINEAPIGDIQTHGDFTKPGSFRQDDLSLATQKRQDKIRRVLQKAPIMIDLHFVNLKYPVDVITHIGPEKDKLGFVTPAMLMHNWGIEIEPKIDALNLVYVQNEGNDRVPLTPWIIAHRLSHSFEYVTGDLYFIKRDLGNTFQQMLEKVEECYSPVSMSLSGVRGKGMAWSTIANVFGTTRTSREKQYKDGRAMEWFHECFAQFCVIGDIKFNPAPAEIGPHISVPWGRREVDEYFASLRKILIDGFSEMLNGCVGKILVF